MSRRPNRITLAVLLLLFVLAATLLANLTLGSHSFVNAQAHSLSNPTHLNPGILNQSFAASVGGVAFDQVASPTEPVKKLDLLYEPEEADGHRLRIKLNGKEHTPLLYDWQLIPIARFSESPYYSCFTLFGKLKDSTKEEEILRHGGRILNYHEAFQNTLLGLRLFQLDVLIGDEASVDLFKENGRYLLGAGERPPVLEQNMSGANDFVRHLQSVETETKVRFRSYIICDYERKVSFDPTAPIFGLSGTPFYFCWRYPSDMPAFSTAHVQGEIEREINVRRRAQSSGERAFLTAELIRAGREYQGKYQLFAAGTFTTMLALDGDAAQTAFLSHYSEESLRRLLMSVRFEMESKKILYLKEYSEKLSDPELLRGINPAVWDAGVNVMRYSAFFRYCKTNWPTVWEAFLKRQQNVAVGPKVETPTIMR